MARLKSVGGKSVGLVSSANGNSDSAEMTVE